MFVVDSVAAGIGKKTLLRGVSFTVKRGTMTAIVGINGVGKSTLLRALGGITKPHAGQVLVDAANVHTIKPRHRATLMTLVAQEENPPGDLTVAEMVALGRLPYLKSWQLGSSKEKDIIARALVTVGISDLADRPCDQLSGGQRRRALLARGFAQETDLVLLDEPTNHLDVHHQLHLLSVLKNSGRTIVATIHDLDLAMSYFDQVVVLHQGAMLCAGHPQTVLIPDNLRKVFDVQALIAQLPEAASPHLIIDSL